MEEQINAIKTNIQKLIDEYPDITGMEIFINDSSKEVTVSIDVLAKLVKEE